MWRLSKCGVPAASSTPPSSERSLTERLLSSIAVDFSWRIIISASDLTSTCRLSCPPCFFFTSQTRLRFLHQIVPPRSDQIKPATSPFLKIKTPQTNSIRLTHHRLQHPHPQQHRHPISHHHSSRPPLAIAIAVAPPYPHPPSIHFRPQFPSIQQPLPLPFLSTQHFPAPPYPSTSSDPPIPVSRPRLPVPTSCPRVRILACHRRRRLAD